MIRSVCVYCGSSRGKGDTFFNAGTALGSSIADHGLRLVYGGGTKGVMGAVAAAAMQAGAPVTGIIPRFLMDKEATGDALERLDRLVVTENMHERKHHMFEQSDAFVALPGGIGTLEEIVEIMTWAQLGRHAKPMVLANIDGFWDPLIGLMDHMGAAGFLHSAHRVRPIIVSQPQAIIPAILSAAVSSEAKAEGDSAVIDRM